jgi:hypothetical protein
MPNSHLDDKMKVKKGIPKVGIASNNIEKAKRLASDKDLIHRKIQLWANKEENEYAIRLLLNGDPQYEMREKVGRREFIASTNPKERYTHPIAETDKLDLLQNGWDYALKDFVKNYKKERIEMVRSSAPISSKGSDGVEHHDFDDKDEDYPIKFIPLHKCSYCLAGFNNEEEKEIHELKWHI